MCEGADLHAPTRTSSPNNEEYRNRQVGFQQMQGQENGGQILNVTDETTEAPRKSSSSSDSYCDCNFCLQNGTAQETCADPIARFRAMQDEQSTAHEDSFVQLVPLQEPSSSSWICTTQEPEQYNSTVQRGTEDTRYNNNPLTRFREAHDSTLNSDDSNASSLLSFNYQDDIVASSPCHDVPNNDDVTNYSTDDVTSAHDSTAAMLGSLLLLPAATPQEMGRPDSRLTDSMLVLGSNSHVSRLSDSEGEG